MYMSSLVLATPLSPETDVMPKTNKILKLAAIIIVFILTSFQGLGYGPDGLFPVPEAQGILVYRAISYWPARGRQGQNGLCVFVHDEGRGLIAELACFHLGTSFQGLGYGPDGFYLIHVKSRIGARLDISTVAQPEKNLMRCNYLKKYH